MSTATRRDVRQAVALATELNLFSVTLHGVTWTLYHPGRQPRPGPQSANRDKGKNAATSRRSERSAARLRDFQAAQRFRLAHVFHRWKQLDQMQPPQMLPPARTFAAVVKACRDAGSSGAATQQHLPTAENNRRGLRVRNKLLTAHAGSCLAPKGAVRD